MVALFPNAQWVNLPTIGSNHSSILVHTYYRDKKALSSLNLKLVGYKKKVVRSLLIYHNLICLIRFFITLEESILEQIKYILYAFIDY